MSTLKTVFDSLVSLATHDPTPTPVEPTPEPTPEPRHDGWVSLETGMGVPGKDATTSIYYANSRLISRPELTALWRSNGIAKRIVERKALDATRAKWTYSIQGDDDDSAEDSAKLNSDVWRSLNDLKAINAVYRADVWARLYGTGLVLVHFEGDTLEDYAEPLPDDGPLRPIKRLQVVDAGYGAPIWPLFEDGQPRSLETIEAYRYAPPTGTATQTWHKSRVIRFDETLLPEEYAEAQWFWGEGVIQYVYNALRGEGAAFDASVQYLKDRQYSVWSVQGLIGQLTAKGKENFLFRYRQMLRLRSKTQSLVLDSDTEKLDDRTMTVSGLPDLLDRYPYRVCAVSGYPMIIAYGRAPGGLGDDGSGELEMYLDDVAAIQEYQLRGPIEQLSKLVMRQAGGPTGGRVPEDWSLIFNPLKQESAAETATRRKINAEADVLYVTSGVLSPDEVALSRFSGVEYGNEIMLDIETRELEAETEDQAPDVEDQAPEPEPRLEENAEDENLERDQQ